MLIIKILLLFALGVAVTQSAFAQSATGNANAPKQCYRPDIPCEFPGGWKGFEQFVNEHKKYPQEAKRNNIRGVVRVDFTLDTTGMVIPETIQIKQSVHPLLDQEAIRIIKQSPQWRPTRISQLNKGVETAISVPIKFEE